MNNREGKGMRYSIYEKNMLKMSLKNSQARLQNEEVLQSSLGQHLYANIN